MAFTRDEQFEQAQAFLAGRDAESVTFHREKARKIEARVFSKQDTARVLLELDSLSDDEDGISDEKRWRLFWNEVQVAAQFKADILSRMGDSFRHHQG